MSQRSFGRPLETERPYDLLRGAAALLATVAGVVVAAGIDPDAVDVGLWQAVGGLLLVPAVTTLLLGGYDGWQLIRHIGRRRRQRA